jgi:hypothetical protein
VKKGPAVDEERQNRRGKDRPNFKKPKNTQNKQRKTIQGKTKAKIGKPNKTKT